MEFITDLIERSRGPTGMTTTNLLPKTTELVDAPKEPANAGSVARLVRRFSACSGGGAYWVRDNERKRLIAQCSRVEDAAMVAGSLNQKDAYVEGFALMRDCLLHHHASRKGIRELVRKATEIVNTVPPIPGQGCCQILIQPNIPLTHFLGSEPKQRKRRTERR